MATPRSGRDTWVRLVDRRRCGAHVPGRRCRIGRRSAGSAKINGREMEEIVSWLWGYLARVCGDSNWKKCFGVSVVVVFGSGEVKERSTSALVYFSIKKLCNANNAFEKKKGKRLK